MKKIKVLAVISGILTLLQMVPIIMPILLSLALPVSFKFSEAGAIGIIGGADGPTAIYVTDAINPLVIARYGLLALCALTFVVSVILLVKNKNKNNKQ